MIKRIPLESLEPGMFVSSFDLSWFKHPYVSTKLGVVRNQGLIDELRRLGVTHVEVDTARQHAPRQEQAKDAAPAAVRPKAGKTPACPPASDPERTARFARKLFDQAMTVTKAIMDGAIKGQAVNIEAMRPLMARLIDSVNQNENVLHVMISLKSYDDYTYTHCLNVAAMGVLFGKHIGLAGNQLETLGLAGLLHDVGKCLLPAEIVNKPGKLTDDEFVVMKKHTVLGFDYIKDQPGVPDPVALGVLEHHERHDGTGYPRQIAGREIAGVSRILSVLDVYDALTSDRVYRSRMSPHLALRTLCAKRGSAFPEAILDRFIACVGVYPPGSVVQLRNGYFAVVTGYDERSPLHPSMTIFLGPDARPVRLRRVETLRLRDQPTGSGYEIARHVEPSEVPPPDASFWR